jgi:lysophospholipase L1-like esterase
MKREVFILFAIAAVPGYTQTHWIGTWGAAPSPQIIDTSRMQADRFQLESQTIREIVFASAGANTIRIRLSNAYGAESIEIGDVHVALHGDKSGILPGSDRVVTFGGAPRINIPPNAVVLSDPVKLDVLPGHEVAVSMFLPKHTLAGGIHYGAQQTAYLAAGDLTAAPAFDNPSSITSWLFLTGLDALVPESGGTIVAFGDSITDGAASANDANHRWPNFLARRLIAQNRTDLGVVDEGIGGNRVLHDALPVSIGFGVNGLARYGPDVLEQPGARYVIVLEGINDIGHGGSSAPASEIVSADEIIAGLKQMIARAHERGLKIFGGTLTPFVGTVYPGYYTPEKEVKRKAVNYWIRSSGAFDGVVDFDKAIQDPSDPGRMLPKYDSGDHLHPNDAGYKAMADAIDLSLFR